jgi:hypothetical protein
MNMIRPSLSMILRNMVFSEQEMILQDLVDYSYITMILPSLSMIFWTLGV